MGEFKDRLKQLRKEKKMTQVKLGELLNYGYTAIANYESGRNQPAIADLKKIASIFDVSLDYLLGVNDTRQPFNTESNPERWNLFLQYYSLLDDNSLDDLLMYMQWLVERNEKKKHPFYGDTPTSPTLRIAQNSKEYRKD